MTMDSSLWDTVAKLPEPLKVELLGSATYLLERHAEPKTNQPLEGTFGYGSLAGRIWIADDFDEPLEELSEYM